MPGANAGGGARRAPTTMTLPNFLTLLRILLIPVLVVLFYLPWPWSGAACAGAFALAMLTDLLDGWLARRLEQETRFGAFLDPVADKLIVSAALVLIVSREQSLVAVAPAMIVIGREIAVSALREWMAQLGRRSLVRVSQLGKVKTVAQAAAIVLMLYHEPVFGFNTNFAGLVLLYVAAALTLVSMTVYLRSAWRHLRPDGGEGE